MEELYLQELTFSDREFQALSNDESAGVTQTPKSDEVATQPRHVSRQLRRVPSQGTSVLVENTLAFDHSFRRHVYQIGRPYNDITGHVLGCESVRTRYDLFRTTGQGILI